jgi:hypothetical protein
VPKRLNLKERSQRAHSHASIDGSVAPDRIPDSVVYRIMFRLLASDQRFGTGDHPFIKRMVLAASSASSCSAQACVKSQILNDEATDQLFRISREFVAADAVLRKRRRVAESGRRFGEVLMIRGQQEKLLNDTINRLPSHLGDANSAAIHNYVSKYMKRSVKIVLGDGHTSD